MAFDYQVDLSFAIQLSVKFYIVVNYILLFNQSYSNYNDSWPNHGSFDGDLKASKTNVVIISREFVSCFALDPEVDKHDVITFLNDSCLIH